MEYSFIVFFYESKAVRASDLSCPRSYRTGVRTLISVTKNSIFFPIECSWIWTARNIGRYQLILLDDCWVGNETSINLNIIHYRLVNTKPS